MLGVSIRRKDADRPRHVFNVRAEVSNDFDDAHNAYRGDKRRVIVFKQASCIKPLLNTTPAIGIPYALHPEVSSVSFLDPKLDRSYTLFRLAL